MMSLDDVFSIEELRDWYDSVLRDLDWPESKPLPMSCEVKIDGLALNLIYRNGVLEQGLTRGDGVPAERPSPIRATPRPVRCGRRTRASPRPAA